MEIETPTPQLPADDAGGDHDRGASGRWRRGLPAGAALVGLLLGSVAIVLALDDRGTAPPDVAADEELVDPVTGGMALCAAMYSPATLVEREIAFVGTVLSIDGDLIDFEVEEVLNGDPGDPARLGGAEFLTTPNPDNVNPIAVGDRLLVAGDGGFAWGCGFTQPYDEGVAAEWRAAFPG